eukprot:367379-Prymnesium_polylepis.1
MGVKRHFQNPTLWHQQASLARFRERWGRSCISRPRCSTAGLRRCASTELRCCPSAASLRCNAAAEEAGRTRCRGA